MNILKNAFALAIVAVVILSAFFIGVHASLDSVSVVDCIKHAVR